MALLDCNNSSTMSIRLNSSVVHTSHSLDAELSLETWHIIVSVLWAD